MNNKIGIIITTFCRDELLAKTVKSVYEHLHTNDYELIIVDQHASTEKATLYSHLFHYSSVAFDSGLSYGRNFGVQRAKELGCEYILIASDSFLFNKSIKKLNECKHMMEIESLDCLGFELDGCCCGWEANLSLDVTGFTLNFIDKSEDKPFYKCDIVRNFFLATTESLLDTKWDENLKLAEHEDTFWRYKQKGYKVAWTNKIIAEKMTDRPMEYLSYRKQNFKNGLQYLRKKYKTTGWVNYIHLDRAKKPLTS